ncbi:MAG: HD domain-containing protein [Spirochaetaceae bacterium]
MSSPREKTLLHLIRDYTEPIRDPIWKNIHISPGFKKLISLPIFQKLGRIKQLGPAYLVYPGAVHTRLNHSLGVFHLARLLMISLLEREDSAHGLPGSLSVEGVKSFLTAALLHDLGHFPFAHSLKELPLKSHETLGAEEIQSNPIAGVAGSELGCDPGRVAAIIDEDRNAEGDEEVLYFRRLLSGVLDPDKLDYLNRDAYFCGVPYGVQDTEYVFQKIHPHYSRGIALDGEGITALENILFSKYLMYRTVYWHRVVRTATAMIKHPLIMAMSEGTLTPEELYWLDDEQFFSRFPARKDSSYSLISRVTSRDLFKTALEKPFDPVRHGKLLSLEERLVKSEEAAARLSGVCSRTVQPWEVIVDIPEPISFEIELPLVERAEPQDLPDTVSVFSPPVVEGFTASMRKIRIFAPADLISPLKKMEDTLI